MTKTLIEHFEKTYFNLIAISHDCLTNEQNTSYDTAFKAVQELQTSLKDTPEDIMKKMAGSLLQIISEDELDFDGIMTILKEWSK